MGDAIAAQINAQVPLVLDPPLLLYVNRLGYRLARASERPELSYRFYIVNTEAVNAFALPGGHIYVTRGLLERTETASQLAGVLAHEIGHVAARHGAQALERELRTGSVVSMLYDLFFGGLGGEPPLLDQQALHLGTRIWSARHSRAAEREADQLAVRYLIGSGFDPRGMVTILEGLLEEEAEQPHPAVELFSSHPMTTNRIRVLERKIKRVSAERSHDLREDIASFPAFLQRLEALPRPLFLGDS